MKNPVFVSTVLIVLSGCSEVRTESTDVAHLDYVNRIYYLAQQSAIKAGCYELDNGSAEQETCINNEIDNMVKSRSKSQFSRSRKVVKQLEDEGKVAKTDDGMGWHYIADGKD